MTNDDPVLDPETELFGQTPKVTPMARSGKRRDNAAPSSPEDLPGLQTKPMEENVDLELVVNEEVEGEMSAPIIPVQNKPDYSSVLLEGRVHEHYEYPDLVVDIGKLSLHDAYPALKRLMPVHLSNKKTLLQEIVSRAVKQGNNRPWLEPKGHLGYLTWNESEKTLHKMGYFMLTLRQYLDFIDLLKKGAGGKKRIYTSEGQLVPASIIVSMLEKATGSFHGSVEWLDTSFDYDSEKGKTMISYHRIDSDGRLKLVKETLEPCFPSERFFQKKSSLVYGNHYDEPTIVNSGIELETVLKSANYQGLPVAADTPGQLCYYPPSFLHGRATSFSWNGESCSLNCRRIPEEFSPYNGVRIARLR